LYSACPNTDPTDATFSTPDAATIRKIANTCGIPQTIRLFIPVTMWPRSSITWAAKRPAMTIAPPRATSAQKRRGARGMVAVVAIGAQSP
jgi:hypothetical protein